MLLLRLEQEKSLRKRRKLRVTGTGAAERITVRNSAQKCAKKDPLRGQLMLVATAAD